MTLSPRGNLFRLFGRLAGRYWLIKTQVLYRPLFHALGPRTRIIKPLSLRGLEYIYLGANVTINRYTWLFARPLVENDNPKLIIGDGSEIGHFNHITCVDHVEIGKKVLTADGVH